MARKGRIGRKGRKFKESKRKRQKSSVDEATLIRLNKQLEEFRASEDEGSSVNIWMLTAVYTFEAGLSWNERSVIHQLCWKMGMKTKRSGGGCKVSGRKRCISVYKNKKVSTMKGLDSLHCLEFSEVAKEVLMDLFKTLSTW
ncbi:DExH-box ATP-dependent RNA helicase DExH6-like [Quillaja saponaria]|uniref:DExH-box ATP-dependent RNA helicase DExH6-like n=1 Tax=Quillaja saponaria TaxID=32244 RepID=A0AAD7LLZ7_QUISA|nr:DExH-box ATP-dependent RNA helicase DExH6-like [Quillaja saponaria]